MPHGPYWLFSGYFSLYFGILGVWIPYWPLYLSSLSFSSEMIGSLTALALGVKVLGPPVWGRLADHEPIGRRPVLIGTSIATAFLFTLVFFGQSYGWLILFIFLYSFVHAGPLAIVDTAAMEWVARHDADYGRMRVWGSIGFIVLALGLGPVVDHYGIPLILWVILVMHASMVLIAWRIPISHHQEASATQESRETKVTLFKHSGIPGFYLSGLMMQFSHSAYYGFYSIHMVDLGFSKTTIGLFWALGVLAEVFVMAHSRWLLKRVGISTLLTGSLLLATLRWLALASVSHWLPLLFVQLLHAFTFGAFHIASVRRVHESAPIDQRATAQGWYHALSFGCGGGLGLLFSGAWFDQLGAESLYTLMAASSLTGVLVSLQSCRKLERNKPAKTRAC
ncbi:MAG: MFS transporter [Magnetococcales bacterium]|nr:MFS transporter [Magnetococcales bacterium]